MFEILITFAIEVYSFFIKILDCQHVAGKSFFCGLSWRFTHVPDAI